MFETPEHARAALAAHFAPELVEPMMVALVPAIVLAPCDDGAPVVLGGSRLGGTPDLPPGLDWPRPVPPADPEDIARRGNDEAGAMMREHMAAELPYAFIGQIDLAEAAALGSVAAPLPGEGRLLFFYDLVVGPWEAGMRTVRVIWDRAPPDRLTTTPMPASLTAAIQRERREMEEAFARAGLDLPDALSSNYTAPAVSVSLATVLRLPNLFSLEGVGLQAGAAKPHDEMTEDELRRHEALEDFMEEHDSFDHDGWRRQQLLGSPMPEQDDPRYQAVACELGQRFLTTEDRRSREEIEAAVAAWRLLLQVDLADWTRADFVEGTVYFLIRAKDLAERRFEGVVAVYQQT